MKARMEEQSSILISPEDVRIEIHRLKYCVDGLVLALKTYRKSALCNLKLVDINSREKFVVAKDFFEQGLLS
jgi:hypothetical protein